MWAPKPRRTWYKVSHQWLRRQRSRPVPSVKLWLPASTRWPPRRWRRQKTSWSPLGWYARRTWNNPRLLRTRRPKSKRMKRPRVEETRRLPSATEAQGTPPLPWIPSPLGTISALPKVPCGLPPFSAPQPGARSLSTRARYCQRQRPLLALFALWSAGSRKSDAAVIFFLNDSK